MRRLMLAAATASMMSLSAVQTAAAQTGAAGMGAVGLSEAGGEVAVYQAALACTAAMRHEAVESGEASAQTAADRMAALAVSSGEGLGMKPDDVQAHIANLNETYAEAASDNPERHRRMVAQCALLAQGRDATRE